jgi:hypothetical protein
MEMIDAEYRGFIISYPLLRMHTAWWTVNLGSDDPRLSDMLGNRAEIFDDHDSLDGAIKKAKQRADKLLL